MSSQKKWNGIKLKFDLSSNSYSISFPLISIKDAVVKAETENNKFTDYKWSLVEGKDNEISFSAQML